MDCGHSRGRGRGWAGRTVCTLSHVKQTASGKLLYGPGGSAACSVKEGGSCSAWAGGRLKREGIYVYVQLIHVIVQRTWAQHYKSIILQWKNITVHVSLNSWSFWGENQFPLMFVCSTQIIIESRNITLNFMQGHRAIMSQQEWEVPWQPPALDFGRSGVWNYKALI